MSLHDFQRLQDKLSSVEDPVSFLVNLFAHSPVGFAVWTADGFPLLTNQAFIDIFEVEPPPEYNVLKDDLLEKTGFLDYFRRAFQGETVHVPTFWYDPRDLEIIHMTEGRRVAVSMTIFPLFKSSGELEFVAATYKNETEIAQLNNNLEQLVNERTIQLNAVNRELEAFSYSVAHDLRAPLRTIDGFAKVLSDEHEHRLDAQAKVLLQNIRDSAHNMSHLIDALLNLARITRNEPKPTVVDLSALAKQITNQLIAAEPQRPNTICLEEGLRARMDSALAWTLLENLFSNAWKFSSNTPVIKIEMGEKTVDGKRTLFISDHGAGFDQSLASSLFKPFQRLHASQDFPGTGVGLATVNRIIDHYGGRIWAESAVGKGTTFYFTLPMATP